MSDFESSATGGCGRRGGLAGDSRNLRPRSSGALPDFPESLDTIHGGAEHLREQVAEMTDNKFNSGCFEAGELGPGLQALDATSRTQTRYGQHRLLGHYVDKDPTFAIYET